MIKYTTGDLFSDDADALINTVNTEGVMGKGLAFQFKERFPKNFMIYRDACKKEILSTGKVLLVKNTENTGPKYIINFPTKAHWREKSKIEYIEQGLDDLVHIVKKEGIKSVAVPALGSGLGGLPWSQVERVIYDKLNNVKDVEWRVYAPNDAPPKPKSLKLTIARSSLIVALDRYIKSTRKRQLSELEAQCLLYILGHIDNTLNKITFDEFEQAPYSQILHDAFKKMDGEFIYISGINKPIDKTMITLDSALTLRAEKMLLGSSSEKTISTVINVISGYTSNNGMTIMASTLWSAIQSQEYSSNLNNEIIIRNTLGLISKYAKASEAMIADSLSRLINNGII